MATATMIRPGSSPETEKAESAMELRTAYLMCQRSVCGHAWDPYSDPDYGVEGSAQWFSVRCPRCTTSRHYLIFRGERIRKKYVYPDDYGLGGDVTAEELWTEVLVREADGRLVVKAKRIRGTKVKVAV